MSFVDFCGFQMELNSHVSLCQRMLNSSIHPVVMSNLFLISKYIFVLIIMTLKPQNHINITFTMVFKKSIGLNYRMTQTNWKHLYVIIYYLVFLSVYPYWFNIMCPYCQCSLCLWFLFLFLFFLSEQYWRSVIEPYF